MSANDEVDWIAARSTGSACRFKEKKPFLGICLGAQMLGAPPWLIASVRTLKGASKSAITRSTRPSTAIRFATADFQTRSTSGTARGSTYQMERFCSQKGAISRRRPSARPGGLWLSVPPEVTLPMICRWSARSSERLDCPGARPLHRHFEGWFRHDRAIARWSGAFLESWLGRSPAPDPAGFIGLPRLTPKPGEKYPAVPAGFPAIPYQTECNSGDARKR